jgi:hypothetical protein
MEFTFGVGIGSVGCSTSTPLSLMARAFCRAPGRLDLTVPNGTGTSRSSLNDFAHKPVPQWDTQRLLHGSADEKPTFQHADSSRFSVPSDEHQSCTA